MNFKEKMKMIEYLFHTDKKLENRKRELEKIERIIEIKKSELEDVYKNISKKKAKLESLKIEAIELENFINSKFKECDCDYTVDIDINNCYIVGINGKKYIAIKKCDIKTSDWYTPTTGCFITRTYKYYDVLNTDNNGDFKFFHSYAYVYPEHLGTYYINIDGKKPDYEKHILKAYPELIAFEDNKVPNTYLKKIYYEVNELQNNPLIKSLYTPPIEKEEKGQRLVKTNISQNKG